MKDWNIKEEKAQNAIYLKEDNGGKGRFFRARFLQAGLVKYSFGVCLLKKETIDKFVYGFVGCPVVIDHKDVTDESAKDLRVGVISKVEFDQFDAWYWCEGVIFDQEAIDLINNGYNVSCQYEITQYATNDRKELHNGNPYDKEILDGAPEHLAIVKNPRYENAMIAVNAIDVNADEDFSENLEWEEDDKTAQNSTDFVTSFKDTLYTVLAEGITNRLGELIAQNKNSTEKWITIKGNHILLKDGESIADAFKRTTGASLSKGNKYEQKDTYKTNEAYKKILDNVKKSNEADLTPDEVIINALNKLGIDKQKLLNKINEADMYNAGVYETHKRYSDGNGVYKRERAEYHKEIIKELFKNAKNAKPKNGEKPTFMFLGGRGGSGKSKFDGLVYDKNNYIVLDADAIKELLPEYKGYNAFEVHEESSDILKQALRKAQKEGLNVVLDATMKSLPSSEKHLKSFVDAGYNIEMYYMHLPRKKAAERAIGRFMGKNGRYVPLEVLLSMKDNEQNFDKLKKYASKWAFYNNDVASKEDDPILVDKNY